MWAAIEFPYELYGMMEAITTSFSFTIGWFSFVLSYLTQEYFLGEYRKTYLIILIPTCFFYLFPLLLYLSEKKEQDSYSSSSEHSNVSDDQERKARILFRQSSRSR